MASADYEAADLSERLERIRKLTEELFRVQSSSTDARRLADQIEAEIRAARRALAISK